MSQGFVDSNGNYIKAAGNFSVSNAPTATTTCAGLLSPEDKQKVDKAYTTDNIASDSSIEALFNIN